MTQSPGERGCLITLEGGEGAGKSSNIDCLRAWIEARGHSVIVTREPGGTDAAEAIRELLMGRDDLPGMSELLLMFAARAAHLQDRIWPALEQGSWVLCDRFTDSSYAYQGAARNIGEGSVAVLEQLVQGDFHPDLTFVFDVPPEQGLARVSARESNNRFDDEALGFHQRVRQAYLARARLAPERYAVIDASAPLATVQQALRGVLEDKWPTKS